jgi:hypothetical protein
VKDRCRLLLHQATPGAKVTGTDAAFLLDMLQHHPDAAAKIGAGVSYFTVELNAPYGTPGFWLHRVDGTAEAFSYLKCLRPRSRQHPVTQALRRAVAPDIVRFRDTVLSAQPVITCPVTGDPAIAGNCDVDHAPPWTFARLAAAFLQTEGEVRIDYPEVGSVMADADQERRWRDFHNSHATLRVVSVRGNARGRE